MNHILLRCCAVLLIGSGLFWHKPAHAQVVTCSASMTNITFGNVNPLSSSTNVTGTLSYTCTNNALLAAQYITACFSVGNGVQSPQMDPRQMRDAANDILYFRLYQDAGRSIIWGSQFVGTASPLMLNLIVPAGISIVLPGKLSGTATMYGQVLSGQSTAIPNNYQDVFSGNHTAITVNNGGSAFPNSCNTSVVGTSPFTASATVVKQCAVNASALNFGSGVGLLTSAVNATTTLDVQCSNGAPYNVGLNAGLNGGGSINARKMVRGANSIAYQLYQNSARTTVWGNIAGSNTVAGTGNGNLQSLTVYGSVPAQTTPPAGTYNDTITVIVTY